MLEGHAIAFFGVTQPLLGMIALQLTGLEGGGHRIEGIAELAELAHAAPQPRPALELSAGDATGHGDQLFDRTKDEQLAADNRRDDAGHENEPELPQIAAQHAIGGRERNGAFDPHPDVESGLDAGGHRRTDVEAMDAVDADFLLHAVVPTERPLHERRIRHLLAAPALG